MSILARKPSTVEERSDAIVKKLEVLDQRLASKVTVCLFLLVWLNSEGYMYRHTVSKHFILYILLLLGKGEV